MRKAVITGATGMIGISLIKYLLNQEIEVIAIIRKDSNRKERLPIDEKLKVIECNLEDIKNLNLEIFDCDVLYHLAWESTSREDSNEQTRNIRYTLDTVYLANRLGCNLFIGAGSQAEYGRVNEKMSPDTPCNPENAYGVAKLCAGQMSRILANDLDMKHIWTRIFSVYGENDREHTMIMSSIKNMSDGVKMKYTKAEQVWDYIYVEDIARALYLIAEMGKKDSIYCIGSGKTRLLSEYILDIRDAIDKNIEITLGELEYSERQVMHLYADISSLTKDTRIYSRN